MGFAETRWANLPSTGSLTYRPHTNRSVVAPASVSVINARGRFLKDGPEPERTMQCDALLALPTAALGNRIRAPDASLRNVSMALRNLES